MQLRFITYCLTTFLCCLAGITNAQEQNVVQVNGIVVSIDTMRVIPSVVVQVKNKNRGVVTNDKGIFTIVCFKGDTLQFSELGFRDKEYTVPANAGQYISLIQPMLQDTFYLPEYVVKALPSKAEFYYAFINWNVPNDKYEIARRNTNKYTLRAIAYTLPRDGRESQAMYQSLQSTNAIYYGTNVRPMNVLSPLAWAEFL